LATAAVSKLWYVTRKFPPSVGGMENLSYQIAHELAQHEPTELVRWGGSAIGLPWFAVLSTFRLAAGLLRKDVRVLLLGDPSLAWLGLLAKSCGTRVAVVVHGLDVTYPRRLYQIYLRLCFWRRFDAYICISTHVKKLVAAQGVPAEHIHLIHPGVDIKSPPPDCMPGDTVTLLLLGRLVRRKGALWFVDKVLPQLHQQLPGLRIDIVGDGPDRQEIQAVIARHGLQNCVSLSGSVADEEKARRIMRAHALILPNLPIEGDPEGFGLVALEGAAAGRYVFASDLEGLRDAVRAPHTGGLLPPADADAWIRALASACADAAGLLELGMKARETLITGGATWSNMGNRYRQVLDGLA
jgi:phosphatidylinositol alpha-1,6-mannosyltransferase